MSTALNLPLWQCNSPPNSPDSSEDLDLIIGRFSSVDKPSLYGTLVEDSQIPLDNGMPARVSSATSDCDSVGRYDDDDDECRLNNNVSDSGDCDVEKCSARQGGGGGGCGGSKRRRSGIVSPDYERGKRRKSGGNERRMMEYELGSVGGDVDDDEEDEDDDEEEERERSPRQQHELTPCDEINTRDVTSSRDITSNPWKPCGDGEARRKGSCSAGSYSRRKHHKHHKHKRKGQSPGPEESAVTPVSPKVNPIFLWVRQDDTRIVEVMCEDYDHRNRIRLTRTHLGWRAIPKTERFAAAIIPKAPPTETISDEKQTPRKKVGKKKKKKSKKRKVQTVPKDPVTDMKESSVALTMETMDQSEKDAEDHSSPAPQSPQTPEPIPTELPKRLIKSISCDFSLACKRSKNLVRSGSLDLSIDSETKLELERNFKVQISNLDEDDKSTANEVKDEDTKEEVEAEGPPEEKLPVKVLDITKHDPDLNDADCDELGELLKDIPDLEFVEEEELDEEDEWSTPTDLTVPKARSDTDECPKAKLPVLPPNISPLVTVTSATRPPEPLTAPLPEVTITPIPNPKPAHQQKRQNNFLESLLSSPYPVKPEKDELTVTPKRFPEKKRLPYPDDGRNKKMKMEDITLKSLLARQHIDRSMKIVEVENQLKKSKSKNENENVDISKSRLHELLTDGASSRSSDPIAQLKQVLSNPDLAVPDPLLVPRARLPALVASPASEIPRLLSMHLEKKVEETPCPPLTDSDMLEVSLSNLRSLLSCNSDKMKSTDADGLNSYQKSLEAFLEWQRYQTELLEAQMKNNPLTPSLSSTDIDLATATALNQMLWLPYVELNGSSLSSSINSVFPHNYPGNMTALPHISTNHFPQSSPFLTPTSPMDIDAQMKTLAMWQEAVMSQHNAHQSRKAPNTLLQDVRGVKLPNAQQKKQRPSPIPSPQKMRNHSQQQQQPQKTLFTFDNHLQFQQEAFLRQQHEMQKKQQQRFSEQEKRQESLTDADGKSRGSISVKPLSNLIEKNSRMGKRQSWQQFEQDLRKSAEMTNQMALRWHQFEEEMRKNQGKNKVKMENGGDWYHSSSGQERPPEAEKKTSETAKLKVKNLVDPNMSPPKLLKAIAPDELTAVADDAVPLQDESQAHLWHPLFGSNQIKTQQYNSPWRWTTVTVNGE